MKFLTKLFPDETPLSETSSSIGTLKIRHDKKHEFSVHVVEKTWPNYAAITFKLSQPYGYDSSQHFSVYGDSISSIKNQLTSLIKNRQPIKTIHPKSNWYHTTLSFHPVCFNFIHSPDENDIIYIQRRTPPTLMSMHYGPEFKALLEKYVATA